LAATFAIKTTANLATVSSFSANTGRDASQPPAEPGGNMLARAGTPAETVDECVDR
jgi:hypothetical protein